MVSQLSNINSDEVKRPHLSGWLFLTPARPGAHREQAGDRTVRHIGAWLVSTLIWLPLLIPLLAMDVRVMPVSSEQLSSSAFVVAGWVLTGLFGRYVPSGRWRMAFCGIAHGLVFLVAFFVAYGATLSLPLTQGWFRGGAAPVALDATFTLVSGATIVTALVLAPGLAVDAALGMGVDVRLVVAAGLGLGLGVVTAGRVSSYVALALVPAVIYGAAALVKPSARIGLRMSRGAIALRMVALVVLFACLATLVWLYLLKGWQAFGWHTID